jgi:hypothetical protein
LTVVKFASIGVLLLTVVSFLVQSLWNGLMPSIFGIRTITFWQALGLLVLSKVLFGGFRPRHGGSHPGWRRRMAERWEHMTPEERDNFKQGVRRCCGHARTPDPSTTQAGARA